MITVQKRCDNRKNTVSKVAWTYLGRLDPIYLAENLEIPKISVFFDQNTYFVKKFFVNRYDCSKYPYLGNLGRGIQKSYLFSTEKSVNHQKPCILGSKYQKFELFELVFNMQENAVGKISSKFVRM